MFRSITYVVTEFFVIVLCVVIYLKGFLPYNHINDVNEIEPPSSILNYEINTSAVYNPEIDRLVLVVIDALRTDFITEEYTPYLYQEKACVMNVKVEAPTVTMPRVKALTTGSTPQYVDIILNLGQITKIDDSFLHRAKSAGKKMIFYGDNTWLQLFPEMFDRHDGTSSFFVTDFTEADNNVTRHIPDELQRDDWDMMFLHYLGLDHIGHVKGPFSKLIKPKMLEMDDVITSIYEAVKQWDKRTLLVVTGDHGMKDSGGHGGTSYEETHVPFVVFGNFSCSNEYHVTQNDIAATISALFAINIPATSTGKLILDLFNKDNLEAMLYKMYYNLKILQEKSHVCNDILGEAFIMHEKYLTSHNENIGEKVEKIYNNCTNEICDIVIKASVVQQMSMLLFSIVLTANNLLNIMISYFTRSSEQKSFSILIVTSYVICHYHIQNSYIEFVIVTSVVLIIVKNIIILSRFMININHQTILVAIHAALLMTSSYIRQEHQIPYFYTTTASLIVFYKVAKDCFPHSLSTLGILSGLRFLRLMHATGAKNASSINLKTWFIDEDHLEVLMFFHAISLLFVFVSINKIFTNTLLDNIITIILLILIFVYKIYSNAALGQLLWVSIALATVKQIVSKSDVSSKVTFIWILTITVLLQPYNVILIPFCLMGFYANQVFIKSTTCKIIVDIWFGYSLYFNQGHDNTLASADISVGYIGSTTYIPEIVMFLTLCHTYAFPVLVLMLMLRENTDKSYEVCVISIILRVVNLLVVYLLTLTGRSHLFVWSVFTPKLLIESVNTTVLFIVIFIFFIFKYLGTFCIRKLGNVELTNTSKNENSKTTLPLLQNSSTLIF